MLQKLKDRHSKKTVQKFHEKIQVLLGKEVEDTDSVFDETKTSQHDTTKASPKKENPDIMVTEPDTTQSTESSQATTCSTIGVSKLSIFTFNLYPFFIENVLFGYMYMHYYIITRFGWPFCHQGPQK